MALILGRAAAPVSRPSTSRRRASTPRYSHGFERRTSDPGCSLSTKASRAQCATASADAPDGSRWCDEFTTLTHAPSAALRLALALPAPHARNFFAAKSYLPSASDWCEIVAQRAQILERQAARRSRFRDTLCAGRDSDTAELFGMLGSRTVRGGVAKLLLYTSESAVRLASRGIRQVAAADATWSFAAGAPGCPHANCSCFFLPTLCEGTATLASSHGVAWGRRGHRDAAEEGTGYRVQGHHDAAEEERDTPELSWPLSLRRAMHVALALEARLPRLQPSLEAEVRALLDKRVRHPPADAAPAAAAAAPPPTTIGMHIRRGDACETMGSAPVVGVTDLDAPRRCYPLSAYLKAAHEMRRLYRASHVLLATDSAEVVERIRRVGRDFTWEWIDVDRGAVGGGEGHNLGKPPSARRYIEHRAEARDPANALVVASLLADLKLLSRADVVVGTSRSFVTVAAQLLVWARSGVLPPIISLEGDPVYALLHVRGRFWRRGEDRGWFPCTYARPHTAARCFSCLNLTVGRSGDGGVCMDESFAARALGVSIRACVDEVGRACAAGDHSVLD